MTVFMFVPMFICMAMLVSMFRRMTVLSLVFVALFVFVRVRMVVAQMNIKLRPFYLEALRTRGMQMVSVQAQLGQLALQVIQPHPKIEHRADKHIAAQAAENIQIKRFHRKVRSKARPRQGH